LNYKTIVLVEEWRQILEPPSAEKIS